jgi:uncharacterized protein YbjQ (UPF0145 family)
MIITTTTSVEGRPVQQYLGVVTGEVIVGANIFKDLFAGIRDIVGGRSGAYESTLRDAREQAFREMEEEAGALGGNAVIGVDIDHGAVGATESMMLVTASGTAVTLA